MKASSAFVTGIVIGAAAGIVAGAAYMKRKIEEVIEDRIDEEVAEFIQDFNAKMEEDDISEEKDQEDEDDDTPYNSLHEYTQKSYNKPDPTKIFRDPLAEHEHPQEPDEESDILEENPLKKQEDDSMKDPKLISEDKYDEDDSFEKSMLYYYQDDDVLTDEEEHEIANDIEIVGETLDKYDFRNNDEQVIHVRNYEQKTDYEVVKVFTSYR